MRETPLSYGIRRPSPQPMSLAQLERGAIGIDSKTAGLNLAVEPGQGRSAVGIVNV